jgi:peptidoglycan/LPS O-acetylase OafA/YrhL
VFGAVALALYSSADLLHLGRVDGSNDIALAYAIALFVIGMPVEPRLRPRRWISYLSERGYAIYLLHGVVLFPLLDLVSRWRTAWWNGPAECSAGDWPTGSADRTGNRARFRWSRPATDSGRYPAGRSRDRDR